MSGGVCAVGWGGGESGQAAGGVIVLPDCQRQRFGSSNCALSLLGHAASDWDGIGLLPL